MTEPSFEFKSEIVKLKRSGKKIKIEARCILEVLELLKMLEDATALGKALTKKDIDIPNKDELEKKNINVDDLKTIVRLIMAFKDKIKTHIIPTFSDITEEELKHERLTLSDLIEITAAIYEVNDIADELFEVKNYQPFLAELVKITKKKKEKK